MNTIHKPFLFFLFLFFYLLGNAQFFPSKNYPKNYFIYPVEARKSLAANFGELRSNHYHMGLDCRTDQVQNKHVKAAADGYIARISIAPFGFGRAIYINHPNGLTTVYGHLNKFFPALEKYVKDKQYELESWNVNLNFEAGRFPVKQGQFIAYSGNTGGSQGPHCHFEIRDTKTDKVLNPLLFDLPIPDNVPPTIVRLAMYDRNNSTYSQSPKTFSLKKVGAHYTTAQNLIITNSDKISFGISANDKQTGSTNPNGIYQAIIYLDEQPLSAFQLDSISYNETRYLNAHIDYKTRAGGGPYIEHLSRLPGYPQGVYKDINGDGVIELQDENIHDVKIEVKDANGNLSTLSFKIKKGLSAGKENQASSSYFEQKEFQPEFVNVFENEKLQLYLPATTLYDSIAFTHSEETSTSPMSYSSVHSILSGLVPAQDYFTVTIKTNKPADEAIADKMLIRQSWKGNTSVIKPLRTGDWYAAKFNAFGDFELIADDVPPVINIDFHDNANISHYRNITITPKDNNDEIKNFHAELDGKWLCFSNDKGRKYIYTFDEKCPRGKHELKVSIQDEAGNTTEKIYHFTR